MDIAKWLIVAGIALALIGLVLQFAPGLLNWFGRLPGDLRFEGENSKVFVPITSMIIISIVLTLLANLTKLFKR